MLDQICFINSQFTRLCFCGCILKPTGGISWTNLKSLSLGCVKVDEDLIHSILSGSPVLETLNLFHVYGFRRIDISSNSVKNLRLCGFIDPHKFPNTAPVIEINAPYIFTLEIQSALMLSKLMLLNVSSLVKAELDYMAGLGHSEAVKKEIEDEMLKGLILKLRHVRDLQIGDLCLEVQLPFYFVICVSL